MTLTDELKILDDKIKSNQAQYNLDREAAKISAISSKELDKYEYLTVEHLGYKPGIVEQVEYNSSIVEQYSVIGKVFNKGLEESDKKRAFKNIKNILKARMKFSQNKLNTKEKDNQICLINNEKTQL